LPKRHIGTSGQTRGGGVGYETKLKRQRQRQSKKKYARFPNNEHKKKYASFACLGMFGAEA